MRLFLLLIASQLAGCAAPLRVRGFGYAGPGVPDLGGADLPPRVTAAASIPVSEGRVIRTRGGAEEVLPLTVGLRLRKGDRIVTGPRTVIATRAGGRVVMDIYPGTTVKLGSIDVLGQIRLWYNQTWAVFRAWNPRPVETPGGGQVHDGGTDFLVTARSEQELVVLVLEGEVTLSSANGGFSPAPVQAGERGHVNPTRGGSVAVATVPAAELQRVQGAVNAIQVSLLGDEARFHPPPVGGLGCDEAMAAVAAAGFDPRITLRTAEGAALETIVDQSPDADDPTRRGATITLYCGAATVPELSGDTLQEATRSAQEAHLELHIRGGADAANFPDAVVMAQSPEEGLARVGTVVEVTLGARVEVVGRSQREAEAALARAGLVPVIASEGPAPADLAEASVTVLRTRSAVVTAQASGAESPVALGSEVRLTVRGPEVEVPEVTAQGGRFDAATWPALKVWFDEKEGGSCNDEGAEFGQDPGVGAIVAVDSAVRVYPCWRTVE